VVIGCIPKGFITDDFEKWQGHFILKEG